LHSSGSRGQAREHALRSALDIVSALPASQRDAHYLDPDPNTAIKGLGPAELAALVPRS
jgi:hypothetical protein